MVLFPGTFLESQLKILTFLTDFLVYRIKAQSLKHGSVLLFAEELAEPLVQAAFQFVHQNLGETVLSKFQVYRGGSQNLSSIHALIVKLISINSSRDRRDWLLTCLLQEFELTFSFDDFRFLALSVLQGVALGQFSDEIALYFVRFLGNAMHFQVSKMDFPEIYTLFCLTRFCVQNGHPLEPLTSSQKKNRSETLNIDLLKGFFQVFVIVATWSIDELSQPQAGNLFSAIFGLLRFHFILAEEENLLLLIGLLEKVQGSRRFFQEIGNRLKLLLGKVEISEKFFPLFTLGLKHLILQGETKGVLNKAYFKHFKKFLYGISEHVKSGLGERLFYQNSLLREVFSLVNLINSKPDLRELFEFLSTSRNFIYSLMDDEQVLKKDIIRLLDEDLLVIEFNCNWDYASEFLSHLHKLGDYSLVQQKSIEWRQARFSRKGASSRVCLGLQGFVTPLNLFELDRSSEVGFTSDPQRVTSVNELVQVDCQVFAFSHKNVLLVQLTVHNITKILVKHLSLQVSCKKIQLYPESILIGGKKEGTNPKRTSRRSKSKGFGCTPRRTRRASTASTST